MSTPTLGPHTMKRLAFIRLLHQQAVDQSHQPEPLGFASVLTFHDAVEFFLILTSEYLGITISDRGRFVDRYWDGLHPSKQPNGVDLSGKLGIKRLTDLRNSFKHSAGMAGSVAIEQARLDATTFLEDNTPKVFHIDFAEIAMADIVPQVETRKKIKESATVEAAGDRVEAMGLLAEAFDEIFREHLATGTFNQSRFSFGSKVTRPIASHTIASVLTQLDGGRRYRSPTHGAEQLGQQIAEVTEIVSSLQGALRVLTLGVEYHRYVRFTQLTPEIAWTAGGESRRYSHPRYAPRLEDFEYCQQFVISAALRAAEMESHITPPPWLDY